MKPGDRVKVTNYKDSTYEIMTVVDVFEESVKLKHDTIGGHFIISANHVSPLKDKDK